MSSPTQRSKKKLEREGYMVAIVERWNQFAHVRQDLFGFIDLLCVKGDELLAVQTTSGSNVSARIAKIQASENAARWLWSDTRKIVVHGWVKKGPRGKMKRWTCREVPVTTTNHTDVCDD